MSCGDCRYYRRKIKECNRCLQLKKMKLQEQLASGDVQLQRKAFRKLKGLEEILTFWHNMLKNFLYYLTDSGVPQIKYDFILKSKYQSIFVCHAMAGNWQKVQNALITTYFTRRSWLNWKKKRIFFKHNFKTKSTWKHN